MSTTQSAEHDVTRRFWLWHGRVGIIMTGAAAGLMAVATVEVPQSHPRALIWLAVCVVLTMGLMWAVLPFLVRAEWRHRAFFLWSLTSVAVILCATAIDGGETSPAANLLVLPILFAGLAYGHRAVVVVGAFAATGYAVIGMTDATRGTDYHVVFTATLVMVTAMAALNAFARERREATLADLTQRLREDSTHDTLTGCLNRRGFEPLVTTALARARRTHESVALAVVDVDWLKDINDTLGHEAGDAALMTVADVLRGQTRDDDAVSRTGGDEFAVLMPAARAADAGTVAARILNALAARPELPRLSVSIGITCVDGGGSDLDALFRSADRALYAAKADGRSCVRIDGLSADGPTAVPAPR